MSIAEIHQLKPKAGATRFMCSACGVDAACNCGAPLMSKAQRIRDAIEDDPTKPNKQIARETDSDPKSVRRERNALKSLDVGGHALPSDEDDPAADDDHETGLRVIAVRGFFNRAAEAKKICTIDKLRPTDITEAMIEAAYDAAAAWETAARDLRGMKTRRA
jgi:hypothetical protein